jgi:hypothetical protein
MKTITRTGFWSDICVLPSGRFAHVVSDRGAVAAYEGVEQAPPLWRQTLPTDVLRFLRCARAPDGSIAAIGQAVDGRAWIVRAGSVEPLDVAAGVNPVAIRHDGQRWVAYTMVAADRCREIRLDGGTRDIQAPAGASGIREVRADGAVVFAESGPAGSPALAVAGYAFDDYARSGGLICGLVGNRIGVLLEAGPHYFSLIAGSVQLGVRGSRNGTRLGVCAMTEAGAFFAEFDQPYPPHEPPVQTSVVQPSITTPQPASPPAVTITAFAPSAGTVPLTVVAKAAITGGVVNTFTWRWRRSGEAEWHSAPPVPSTDVDHTFVFDAPGKYEISLRGDGPGGIAETGMRREVTVNPKVESPRPEPVEVLLSLPIPGNVSFQTASGRFLCSDLGTSDIRLVCDREQVGAWETFELMPAGNARVRFRAANGRFVTAESGGGRELVANRTSAPGPWEEFQIALIGEDRVAIKTSNGRYVSADSGAPGVLHAIGTSPGPAETFKPSRLLGRSFRPGTIQGRLRIDGRAFVNDAGTFRPLFASALSILARSSDDMRGFLDWAARTGFNGIRVFAGALGWAPQSAAQARAVLPQLLTEAAARGLYVEVTAITDSRNGGYDPAEHFRAVARIAEQGSNAILEVANEPYHGTQADAIHSADTLLAMGRQSQLSFALGAAQSDESVEMGGGSFVTAHLDRGRDKWNQVRRVRELAMLSETTRKPVLNNEPIGAGETSDRGRRESDPAFFFCLGALNHIFEVGGVFHSEAGLHAALPGPVQQACADAFVEGSRIVPVDDRLVFKNATWADSPIVKARFDETVIRAYTGVAGSAAWTVLVGLSGDPGLELRSPWRIARRLAQRPGVEVLQLER